VVPLPKPAAGRWEIRERLPQFADDYRYGKRIMYGDKETYFAGAQLDLYDLAGALYKTQLIFSHPALVPGSNGDVAQLAAGPNTSYLINFKDVFPVSTSCTDWSN